jgi:bifunctional DNA-binding transcriptional regulator/antitoxin component of YhaV-PrlF toxin-antitoxin module
MITARLRRKLGIKMGTKISFTRRRGKLIIQPLNQSYFDCLAGILGTEGKMLRSLLQDKKKEYH